MRSMMNRFASVSVADITNLHAQTWYVSGVPSHRIRSTREYLAVQQWYGTRTATRSGVPMMVHIDQGLAILARIEASDAAMRAFCLHPLVQEDEDFAANAPRLRDITTDPYI